MILDRYIIRLCLGPFLGFLIVVLGVLELNRGLNLLGNFADAGQVWGIFAELMMLTVPYLLTLILPMAFFLSMQNMIASLQQTSEMDAMRAAGVSYIRMFRSLLLMAVLFWVGLSFVSMVVLPQTQLSISNMLVKIYASKASINLSSQRFTQGTDDFTIYVDGESSDGSYHGVIIEDKRSSVSVVYLSEEARFQSSATGMQLKMTHGTRLEGQSGDLRMLSFDTYTVTIPVGGNHQLKRYSSGEHVTLMSPKQLWNVISEESTPEAIAEWNRRLLLPTTVLILFFFALPLSLTKKRSGKGGTLFAGIAFLVAIYNIQMVLHRQVEQGAFPGWAMWAVQIVMLVLGSFLWKRVEEGRLPRFFSLLGEWSYLLHQYIQHKVAHRWSKKAT